MQHDPALKHPDVIKFTPVWKKCRAATDGQRAIKEGGMLYLRSLTEQKTDEYEVYLDRASYVNATGRTVDAMVGGVFRKPLKHEVPDAITEWLDDINLADETLSDFAQNAVFEVIVTGRYGVLVEQPKAPDGPLTVAERQSQGLRPYLVGYPTENIINWEYDRVNNRYQLVNIWLQEDYKATNGEIKQQVKQLTLNAGFYQQIIWREGDGSWIVHETITPTKNSVPLTEIPFFAISSKKPTLKVSAPPIESLADVNISHYKNSADLENGAHMAGLPTPYITGLNGAEDDKIYLGSTTILTLPQDATAGFMQCGSEGFATIEKLMDRKEQQMAALGARMLAPDKKQAEAVQTHEIKRSGETSVLATLVGIVDRQLSRALAFAADWEGITGVISIELNKDFFPVTFTAQELTAWTSALQSGAVSKETYFDVLKYSEWISDTLTYEQEQERIASDGPALASMTDPANDNG